MKPAPPVTRMPLWEIIGLLGQGAPVLEGTGADDTIAPQQS
jgi:hypothetical protein